LDEDGILNEGSDAIAWEQDTLAVLLVIIKCENVHESHLHGGHDQLVPLLIVSGESDLLKKREHPSRGDLADGAEE
jgi:hypothetical protein